MNVKESINSQGESFSISENIIHSTENSSYYDAKIKQSILVSLAWYSTVPVHDIEVTVKHGHASVNGLVESRYQELVIAAIVRKTKGVTGVTNNICIMNELMPVSL
jgi:osmotically-inducible protein OsmY